MIRLAIIAAALAACVDVEPEPFRAPPALAWPEVWHGLDDSAERNPVVLMTPEAYQALRAEIEHARIWMRQASVELQQCYGEELQP